MCHLKDEDVTECLNSTDTESDVLHLQKMAVIVMCPIPVTRDICKNRGVTAVIEQGVYIRICYRGLDEHCLGYYYIYMNFFQKKKTGDRYGVFLRILDDGGSLKTN
jgi:hypothetical protein